MIRLLFSSPRPWRAFILSTCITLAPSSWAAGGPAATPLPDIEVLNQRGETVHFYSDLVKDKIVAINFIFTQCTMVCPVLGFHFGQLRKKLAQLPGQDVHLISISIDPVNDSPERLRAWAQQFDSGPGWTQITGSKVAIDTLLKALESFAPEINDHSTLVLIGNDKQQQWQRVDGYSSSTHILAGLKAWL